MSMPQKPQARQIQVPKLGLQGATVRCVGVLVAQSSLAFNQDHTTAAICHNDVEAALAGRLRPTFQGYQGGATSVARTGGLRRNRCSQRSRARWCLLTSSRVSRSRRSAGRETIGSVPIASKVVSAARWRMAQLLPSMQEVRAGTVSGWPQRSGAISATPSANVFRPKYHARWRSNGLPRPAGRRPHGWLPRCRDFCRRRPKPFKTAVASHT